MANPLVALVHYHLRGGGVTRVIEHACQVLPSLGFDTVIVVGEQPKIGFEHEKLLIVPELGYGQSVSDGKALLEKIKSEIISLAGKQPDIWHVHNHCLGKNLSTPRLVQALAEQNQPTLLQPHDFAEDNRPSNYAFMREGEITQILYPQAHHILICTLNGRDKQFLNQAGYRSESLSILANAIHFGMEIPSLETQEWIVYPCRAIKRKNIGEAVLLSLVDEDHEYGSTLAPQNEQELSRYRKWVDFVEKEKLPFIFEIGTKKGLSFPELLGSAKALLTTSIAEGFGLAFLESWSFGKAVYGRNLPIITNDFVETGIDLSHLYSRLDIPLDLLDHTALFQSFKQALKQSYAAYHLPFDSSIAERTWSKAVANEHIDFARLDENSQREILVKIRTQAQLKRHLKEHYASLTVDKTVIERNKTLVSEHFSLHAFGRRLTTIYDHLLAQKPSSVEYIDPKNILLAFLNPDDFTLLRT